VNSGNADAVIYTVPYVLGQIGQLLQPWKRDDRSAHIQSTESCTAYFGTSS
jgi:hypothetical protein